jgi:hypothetical protein
LAYYERILQQNLVREDRMAGALVEIHRRKLYRQTHRSFAAYLRARWGLSRSRAYQLIHFEQRKQHAKLGGGPAPSNERQARKSGDGSTSVHSNQSAYAQLLSRTTRYLQASNAKLPASEQRKFIWDIRAVLVQIEQDLDGRQPAPASASAVLPVKTTCGAEFPSVLCRPVPQENQQQSMPAGPSQMAGATPEVNGDSQREVTAAVMTSSEKALTAKPPLHGSKGQKAFLSGANKSPVLGFTMEQARSLGLCR